MPSALRQGALNRRTRSTPMTHRDTADERNRRNNGPQRPEVRPTRNMQDQRPRTVEPPKLPSSTRQADRSSTASYRVRPAGQTTPTSPARGRTRDPRHAAQPQAESSRSLRLPLASGRIECRHHVFSAYFGTRRTGFLWPWLIGALWDRRRGRNGPQRDRWRIRAQASQEKLHHALGRALVQPLARCRFRPLAC